VLRFCRKAYSQGVYEQHLTLKHSVIDLRPDELPVLELADCGFVGISYYLDGSYFVVEMKEGGEEMIDRIQVSGVWNL
jgi:hypothetical protein